MGVDEIVVVGSSIGGWIGSEMAAQAPARVKGLVLINATGIAVAGHVLVDVRQLALPDLMRLAHHDPAKILAAAPPPSQQALRRPRTPQAMGRPMTNGAECDRTRRACGAAGLSGVAAPVLVVWGESDGIASAGYGAAYAEAFANGLFEPSRPTSPASLFRISSRKERVSAFDRRLPGRQLGLGALGLGGTRERASVERSSSGGHIRPGVVRRTSPLLRYASVATR